MQRRRSARLAGATAPASSSSSSSSSSQGTAKRGAAAGEGWITPSDLLLLGVMLLYLFLCPYNKVEESFNTQATHDLLFLPWTDLGAFDHLAFPGVVPRTFWGPLLLAAPAKGLARPLLGLMGNAGEGTKLPAQLLVRLILGLYLWAAFCIFRRAAARKFGKDTGALLPLITATQFHLPFYMTRTLPNVFALGLILLVYARLLVDDYTASVVLLALSTAVFRCDTLVLALPLLLTFLLRRHLTLGRLVLVGTLAGAGGIGLSVLVDSYFWRRWLWPEGIVLLFNTVENRSAEWGTAPFHWYFTSALPRALLGAIVLIPFGLLLPSGKQPGAMRGKGVRSLLWQPDREPFRLLFLPILGYLALYSLLAHKELRFIFPALPVLNLLAALGLAKLHRRRSRRPVPFLLGCAALLGSVALLPTFLAAARRNYPGAAALAAFHRHLDSTAAHAGDGAPTPIRLHIGVAAAESGVSRFGERLPSPATGMDIIEYSKTENLPLVARVREYDFLIVEPEEAAAAATAACEQVAVVDGAPAPRWRAWLAAVKGGPKGVAALVEEMRQGPWEEWFVSTRPALVLLHCGGGAGGKEGGKEGEGESAGEWMTDE